MRKGKELSEVDCEIIATKIKKDIFKPALSYKTSIFLCGKDLNDKSSIRYKIADVLNNGIWYKGDYDLIYPEDIFDELLYSSNSSDLLSLENLLADSVDAVIVIPESAGSYAELGAFASNEKLRSKMICVVDQKYKGDKSFINQGPIKLVKGVNRDAVIYIDEHSLDKLMYNKVSAFSSILRYPEVDKLTSALRKMKKNSAKVKNKITLLQLDRFLLPAIYLLQPVTKAVLTNISGFAMEDRNNSYSSAATALTTLTKKRFIEVTAEGYMLTTLGKNEFLSFKQKNSRSKQHDKTIAIDDLQLEILNLKYRSKKLKR